MSGASAGGWNGLLKLGLALVSLGVILSGAAWHNWGKVDTPVPAHAIDLSQVGTHSLTFQTRRNDTYEVSLCTQRTPALSVEEQRALLGDKLEPSQGQVVEVTARVFEGDEAVDTRDVSSPFVGADRVERWLIWFTGTPGTRYRLVVKVEAACERLEQTSPTIRVQQPLHIKQQHSMTAGLLLFTGLGLGGPGLLLVLAGGVMAIVRRKAAA